MSMINHPGRRHMLFVAAAAPLSGCGLQPTIATASAVQVAAEGVSVRAEPRVSAEQQEAAFGTNLRGFGILPILVTIRNEGATPLSFLVGDIQLQVGDETFRSARPGMVASRMQEGAGVAGASFAGALLLGVPGALLGSAVVRGGNRAAAESMRRDQGSRALQDGEIAPGTEAQGYIFFLPPPAVRRFDAGTLRVPTLRAGAVAPNAIEIALTGLGYLPVSRG